MLTSDNHHNPAYCHMGSIYQPLPYCQMRSTYEPCELVQTMDKYLDIASVNAESECPPSPTSRLSGENDFLAPS